MRPFGGVGNDRLGPTHKVRSHIAPMLWADNPRLTAHAVPFRRPTRGLPAVEDAVLLEHLGVELRIGARGSAFRATFAATALGLGRSPLGCSTASCLPGAEYGTSCAHDHGR